MIGIAAKEREGKKEEAKALTLQLKEEESRKKFFSLLCSIL